MNYTLSRPMTSPMSAFENALITTAGLTLVAVTLWYIVSLAAYLYARRARNSAVGKTVARWGAPHIRSLAAKTLVTASLTALASPAMAVSEPIDLSWGAELPAATTGAVAELPAGTTGLIGMNGSTAPEKSPPALGIGSGAMLLADRDQPTVGGADSAGMVAEREAVYVVVTGDSLWSIVKEHYAPATDAESARLVDAVWRANSATIGADPDLIYPGQHLTLGPHND